MRHGTSDSISPIGALGAAFVAAVSIVAPLVSPAFACEKEKPASTAAAVQGGARRAPSKAAAAKRSTSDRVAKRPTAGLVVAIDPATGAVVKPTPEQMRELSPGPGSPDRAGALSTVPEVITLPGGGVFVRLGDRYAKYATVRIDPSGRKTYGCSSNPEGPAAAPARAEEK